MAPLPTTPDHSEVLGDAAKGSAHDLLLPEIQWKLKSSSILSLFGPTAFARVADTANRKADGKKKPEADLDATSTLFDLDDEMKHPGGSAVDLAGMEQKDEDAPDAMKVMVMDEEESESERLRKAATAVPKEWEWHQQKEEAKKLAGLFSEKLVKDAATKEILQRIQTLESARVMHVTDLVIKKHAIEDLITELCNIHTAPILPQSAPILPKFLLYRPPHLRASAAQIEKEKKEQDLRIQRLQRLMLERVKEVRLAKVKTEFRKLLDGFTVLNYKILSERVTGGLAKDILNEAKGHRDAEKSFDDWFVELEKAELVRLEEQLRLLKAKDQEMKECMGDWLKKIAEDNKKRKN